MTNVPEWTLAEWTLAALAAAALAAAAGQGPEKLGDDARHESAEFPMAALDQNVAALVSSVTCRQALPTR